MGYTRESQTVAYPGQSCFKFLSDVSSKFFNHIFPVDIGSGFYTAMLISNKALVCQINILDYQYLISAIFIFIQK
jgi:hypothetical protein